MMKQNPKIFIFIITLLSLSFLLLSLKLTFQNLQLRQQISDLTTEKTFLPIPTVWNTPSQVPDNSLANWKTYVSRIYNYEIKFPSTWSLIAPDDKSESTIITSIRKNLNQYPLYELSITSYKDSNTQNLELFKKSTGNWYWYNEPVTRDIIVSGNKAWMIEGQTSFQSNALFWRKYILILNNNTLYELSWVDLPSRNEEEFFNQILSTFRFLDRNGIEQTLPKDCIIGGCSGEICADEEMVSACRYKAEFGCYNSAICERQADGRCGWTQTPELISCLEKFKQGN